MPRKTGARPTHLSRLVDELSERVRQLEEQLGAAPAEPAYVPPPRKPVPIYKDAPLATDGMNAGVNYSGPPSKAASAAGGSGPSLAGYRRQGDGTYWRDPCGILRGPDGEIVTPRVDQPISPVRTPQHDMAVNLIDAMAPVHPEE
jgi:hypothetical protein